MRLFRTLGIVLLPAVAAVTVIALTALAQVPPPNYIGTLFPAGGCTPYHLSGGTAASSNATSVAIGGRTLCKMTAISTSGTIAYLKLYDVNGSPTCSSATGLKHVYPIPANTSGAGFTDGQGAWGEKYANGISFCVTGGGGDTDATNAPTGVFIEGNYN